MTKQVKRLYEFGPFHLDVTERLLRRNGQEIILKPKTYEVLLVLVENSGHIVERETLMQKVWPNSFVEEANINTQISELRRILSEGGDNHQYIETIPRRGYRFKATVKEIVEEVENLTSARNLVPPYSKDLAPLYSDVGHADNKGQWVLVISATIKDIDKPIAEAMEAHLRKLSNDVTLTLLRIEEGSVKLIFESTRVGFERINELVKSGQLSEVFGFDIEDLRWTPRLERVKLEPQHTVQSYPEDLPRRNDRSAQTQPALVLTEPAFNRFLSWLGVDREQAAMRYEEIRQKLIKFFELRGAAYPEDLADETINRVVKKVEQVKDMTSHPESYFLGVARNIYSEYSKSAYLNELMPALQMPDVEGNEGDKMRLEYLEECLHKLSVDERELILAYYKEDKESRVRSRKNLAAQLGISPNSLRIRINRIRSKLEKYISDCMKRSSTDI